MMADIVIATMKQKWEEGCEEDESEEWERSECIARSVMLQCADTLLDFMGQRRFKYRDITAIRKMHTAMKRSVNSSLEQVTITDYFSK